MGLLEYEKLEREYASFNVSSHCVAVNSGTAALHLALVSLGVGPGDEVIVPDLTMAACGFAVSYTGAKVVTVDCTSSLLMDIGDMKRKITDKTKVIMPVHIYGRLCDMKRIYKIAQQKDIYVVEDACEAQGATLGPADLTCHSFYRNKIINAEEGGAITLNNEAMANDLRDLKNMAFGDRHDYFHERIGFNYRIADSQALLARKSILMYPTNNDKRRQIETWYNKYIPKKMKMPKRDAVWVYDIRHPNPESVVPKIEGARYGFKPLSMMPMWKQETGSTVKKIYKNVMYLPVDLSFQEEDIKQIVSKL